MDLHSGGLNTENSIAFTEVQIVRLRNVQTMYYIRLFQTIPFVVLLDNCMTSYHFMLNDNCYAC